MANNFNIRNLQSTGNKIMDTLGGGLIGLAGNTQSPGQYYVHSNWKGNGLADTGLGYIKNEEYRNPYDQAQALSAMLKNPYKDRRDEALGNLGMRDYMIKMRTLPYKLYDPADTNIPMQEYMGNNNRMEELDYGLPTRPMPRFNGFGGGV